MKNQNNNLLKLVVLFLLITVLFTGCSSKTNETVSEGSEVLTSQETPPNYQEADIDVEPKVMTDGSNTAVINAKGELLVTGSNYSNALGFTGNDSPVFVKVMDHVTDVSVGWTMTAIKQGGDLYAWGRDDGISDEKDDVIHEPMKVMSKAKMAWIDYGAALVVTENGDLLAWGYANDEAEKPEKILDDVVYITGNCDGYQSSYVFAAVTKEGKLYTWGETNLAGFGENGDAIEEPRLLLENIKCVSLGDDHSLAVSNEGELFAWGSNEYGQLGDGTDEDCWVPRKVMEHIAQACSGNNFTAAVTENGDLLTWGENYHGALGAGSEYDSGIAESEYHSSPLRVLTNVRSISTGYSTTVALTNNGDVYAFGKNDSGVFGNGIIEDSNKPVLIMNVYDDVTAQDSEEMNQYAAEAEINRDTKFDLTCTEEDGIIQVSVSSNGLGYYFEPEDRTLYLSFMDSKEQLYRVEYESEEDNHKVRIYPLDYEIAYGGWTWDYEDSDCGEAELKDDTIIFSFDISHLGLTKADIPYFGVSVARDGTIVFDSSYELKNDKIVFYNEEGLFDLYYREN